MLSRKSRAPPGNHPSASTTLGLLHDIGRLGLLVAYPDASSRILRPADRDAVFRLDKEKYLFGPDHCEAGRLLLAQWKLPQDFCLGGWPAPRPSFGASPLIC
jgi:HD-like signal output (HDOD) protein